MKQFIWILVPLLLVVACANNKLCKKAQPVIDEYLLGKISHPETYTPTQLEYLGLARVDKSFYNRNYLDPVHDSIDVRVFRQTFKHLNRSGDPTETSFCLYVSDDPWAVLCSNIGENTRSGLKWLEH